MKLKKALVIADGEKLSYARLQTLLEDRVIVVLDGAYEYVRRLGVGMDYLLGDFDSISPELLQEARQLEHLQVQQLPDQSATDLDKAIAFLIELGCDDIAIACAMGERTDHSLHNIQLLAKHADSAVRLCVYNETEKLFAVKDAELSYQLSPKDRLSVFAAPDCVVTSDGLYYDMSDYAMSYAGKNSGCNWAVKEVVTLAVQGCALIIHQDLML